MITRHTTAPILAALGVFLASPAVGQQQPEVGRAILQRDQQSAEFALRLQQSQQAAELQRIRPEDSSLRQEMESLHLQQRQRLDELNARQLLDAQTSGGRASPINPQPASSPDHVREQAAAERHQALDRAERELNQQLREAREAKDAKDAAERPRWGPTLERWQ